MLWFVLPVCKPSFVCMHSKILQITTQVIHWFYFHFLFTFDSTYKYQLSLLNLNFSICKLGIVQFTSPIKSNINTKEIWDGEMNANVNNLLSFSTGFMESCNSITLTNPHFLLVNDHPPLEILTRPTWGMVGMEVGVTKIRLVTQTHTF